MFPALISYDKNGLNYHNGNAKNSFNLVISNNKRNYGTTAPDCLLHRSVKRNNPNRSRNSPPVHLALKSHREFVDVDSTEVNFLIFLKIDFLKLLIKEPIEI